MRTLKIIDDEKSKMSEYLQKNYKGFDIDYLMVLWTIKIQVENCMVQNLVRLIYDEAFVPVVNVWVFGVFHPVVNQIEKKSIFSWVVSLVLRSSALRFVIQVFDSAVSSQTENKFREILKKMKCCGIRKDKFGLRNQETPIENIDDRIWIEVWKKLSWQ